MNSDNFNYSIFKFDLICIMILLIILIISALYFLCKSIYKDIITKNKQSKESENNKAEFPVELQKLYSTIDIDAVNTEIDKYIKSYLDDYIIRNVTIQGSEYIKQSDIDIMLREVLFNIVSNISDLYKWYISLLINIDNEDDMIDFIRNRLSLHIIAFTSKFNQTK